MSHQDHELLRFAKDVENFTDEFFQRPELTIQELADPGLHFQAISSPDIYTSGAVPSAYVHTSGAVSSAYAYSNLNTRVLNSGNWRADNNEDFAFCHMGHG